MVFVKDININGSEAKIPARIYEPSSSSLGAVLYYHWGGWVKGSIEESDKDCKLLSDTCGCTVISVGYRLAPNYRFPSALIDSFDALLWVYDNASDLRIKKDSIAAMGVSSGGNLVAVMSLMARDRGIKLRLQVLVTPVIGLDPFSSSAAMYGSKGLPFEMDVVAGYIRAYLGDLKEAFNPLFTPIFSDLKGAPPALIITAEEDPLRDQGETYAKRLRESGVPVISVRINGTNHGLDKVSNYIAHLLSADVLKKTFLESSWIS